MQTTAYEGYFHNGRFYASGNAVQIPEKRRIVITVLEEPQRIEAPHSKLKFDFVTDMPPLPDSFFDPLPEEELEMWGL